MEAGWDFAVRNQGVTVQPGRSATLRIALRPPGGKVARSITLPIAIHSSDPPVNGRPADAQRSSGVVGGFDLLARVARPGAPPPPFALPAEPPAAKPLPYPEPYVEPPPP